MKKVNINHAFNTEFGGNIFDIDIKENNVQKENTSIWIKLLAGMIIGFVNGFWGGGGGMICVVLLTQVIKLEEKKAHATTLLIMLPLSITSLIVYIIKGNILWIEALKIGVGFVLGGLLGANLLKKLSNEWVSIIFSLVIIYAGVKMIL